MTDKSNASQQNGAQLVVRALEAEGVTHVFGIPGAKIDAVFNALVDSKIQTVVCRHEQNAAFIGVPVSPKREWVNWVLVVRRAMGLPEYGFADKVFNRVDKLVWHWNACLLPLEAGEVFWVWLFAILSLLVVAAGHVVLGFIVGGLMFVAAMVIAGLICFTATGILGLFRH